jgi:methyl-accepting chemotaxis protein-2 (aspartate sensor receptor)
MHMPFSRSATLGAKLALIACLLVALMFTAFTWALTRAAGQQVSDEALARIEHDNRAVAQMIALYDKGLVAEVDRFMSLFESFLPGPYTLDETQKVDINGQAAPTFSAAGKPLDLDFTVPDQFLARSSAIATVFARTGEDFVRVTTSLKKQDGSRAIGTLLDRKSAAYAALTSGKTYSGIAQLFGKQYITQYKPVTDASGKVIGALFVGVDVSDEIASVAERIRQRKIGEHGYYFVIDASGGPNRGKFIVHPSAQGQAANDANGPWQQMLSEKDGTVSFSSADGTLGEQAASEKEAVFVTVPEWQWLVGGVAYRSEVMARINATRNWFFGIGIACVAIFALIFVAVVRALIGRPLERAVKVSEQLAAGDLTARVATTRGDEIGRLMQAIDGIGTGLAEIVSHVRGVSADMTARTEWIASANSDIAGRIASGAASLEETSASMEQLTSTVKQNADSTAEANALVANAAQAALDGGAAVQRVVTTMDEISRSAQKIADITGVIEGIAFQINILALNAAVESARAGEHGRGFAVVAGEVRALAQRSAAAVKEIEALIAESVGKVDSGHRIADEARETMEAIVGRVEQVRAIMSEIDVATREQTGGIEQVNVAITHVGDTTQQNARVVGDAERATAELRGVAEQLLQAVSAFRVN